MKNLSRTLKPIYTLEQLNSAIGPVNGRSPKTTMQIGKIGRFIKLQDESYVTAGPIKLILRKMKFLIRNGEFATHAGELNAAKSLVEKIEALNKQGDHLLKKASFFKRIAIWINQAFDRFGFQHRKEFKTLIKKYPVLKQPLIVQGVVNEQQEIRSPNTPATSTASTKNNSAKEPSKNTPKGVPVKSNPDIAPLPPSKQKSSPEIPVDMLLSTDNDEVVFSQIHQPNPLNQENKADLAITVAYLAKDQKATGEALATLMIEESSKWPADTDQKNLLMRNELAKYSNLPMCLNEDGPLHFGDQVEISKDGVLLLMDRSDATYVNLFALFAEKKIKKALMMGNQQVIAFRLHEGVYEFFDPQGASDIMGQSNPYVKRCHTVEEAIFYLQQKLPSIGGLDEPAFTTLSVTPLRAFTEAFKESFEIPDYVPDPEEFVPVLLEGTVPYFKNYYRGALQDGAPHGEGREYNAEGMLVYKGSYEHGQRHGNGTMIMRMQDPLNTDCHRYVGNFEGNKVTGKGIYYWKNGNIYSGGMKNSKQDGFGVTVYQNGKIIVGRYKDHVRDGEGRLFENGEWKKVRYDQGKQVEKTE